jgi:tetratricopeptide (TPR) repeat protein
MLCGALWAQQPAPKSQSAQAPAKQQAEQKEQAPPEEDEELQPAKEYTFNPLQAEKELRIGNYYFKKGSYKAAVNRFQEATRWNANLAEAYVRLGDAEEKRKNRKGAREAYTKFLELAPEDKRADEIRKKLGTNK